MRVTLYVVVDSENEPEVFNTSERAYEYMRNEFISHGQKYGYDDEDMDCCFEELCGSFGISKTTKFFSSYLGERDIECYEKTIDL